MAFLRVSLPLNIVHDRSINWSFTLPREGTGVDGKTSGGCVEMEVGRRLARYILWSEEKVARDS